MFQRHRNSPDRWQSMTTVVVLIAISGAIAVTSWLIWELHHEQAAINELMHLGHPGIAGRLQAMSAKLGHHLSLMTVVLAVLLCVAVTRILIAFAYATSQQTLRDTKTLAWHVFASLDQGLITTDTSGIVTSANPEASRLFNSRGDLVGRPLSTICEEGSPLSQIPHRVLESGKAEHDQDFTARQAGHLLRLRTHCNLLRNDADEVAGVVLHVRDVTERYFIEEQLRRMERYLGLGSMAASLHHEINNPLSALSLHLQLLDEKLVPQADAETRETMQVLQSEIARIISVLSGFREYASVLTIHHDLTDLGSIVQRTAALVRPQADRSGVRIQVTLGSGSLLISADAGLLEQVMLNLVLNALDVMPDGGELRLEARNDGERMRLTVQDTGGGIQPELHSRLFDPFFTTKPNGSGMGLALCEKIVREHGGEIDYHTSPEGTRFDVMLPCRPPCPPPAGEPGCPSCDDKVS